MRSAVSLPRARRRTSTWATLLGVVLTVLTTSGAIATGVGVTVTTGTTILPPPAIELGGPGGARLTSVPVTLAWWTNDDAMAIVTVGTDLTCREATCGAPSAPDTIGAAALSLLDPSGAGLPLDRSRIVTILGSTPSETASTTALVVSLALPDVRPGRYVGTLRFTVVDPSMGDLADVADGLGASGRVVAAPDGSALIASQVVVIVS